MTRPYSQDLRARVVAAVAAGGSCRAVADRFSIGVSSVVRWAQRFRMTGSVAAKPMGGARRQGLASEREWLLARLVESPTLPCGRSWRNLGSAGSRRATGPCGGSARART
jgi:transposase